MGRGKRRGLPLALSAVRVAGGGRTCLPPPSLDKWLEKLRPPTLMSSTIELMTILYQGRGRREAGWLAARGAHMEKNAEEEKKIS